MKKTYKGFVIVELVGGSYKFHVYTKEEWAMGAGYRNPEWECDNLQEAKEFIDCY